MKTVMIASKNGEKRRKLASLLRSVGFFDYVSASSIAEIASVSGDEREGVLVVASMNISALSEVSRILPTGWDIIAILPSGMPQPFWSSNLTVLGAPVSRIEFNETLSSLMASSAFRKTEYGQDKDEIISQAKKKLMREKSTDENSAHRYLQKKSMESGKSIFEMAKAILSE